MELLQDEMTSKMSLWDFKGAVPYVDEWFLMRSPVPMLLIIVAYLLLSLKLGPEYMKNRPAYNLKKVLGFYNAAQVAYSVYLCYLGTKLIWSNGIVSTSCLMDREDTKLLVTSTIYAYFIAKLSELLDTIFFVLKKNYRQITFLHVYHHFIMLTVSWLALKFEPSYSGIFLGTLNSYVHVIMYTYYGLSAFPELSKYLWWKKYITKLQIFQFMLVILQAAANYIYSVCPPSYTLLITIFINALLFLGLFANFYIQAYRKPQKID